MEKIHLINKFLQDNEFNVEYFENIFDRETLKGLLESVLSLYDNEISQSNLLKILEYLEDIGDLDTVDSFVIFGSRHIQNEIVIKNVLDSISVLSHLLNKEGRSQLKLKTIDFLIDVYNVWKENRFIIIYSGISIILEHWMPEKIRINKKEYWDYSAEEIFNILIEIKKSLQVS